MTPDEITRIYEYAKDCYCDPSDNEIELDDLDKYLDPNGANRFSEADGGCWIQVWAWVPNPPEEADPE